MKHSYGSRMRCCGNIACVCVCADVAFKCKGITQKNAAIAVARLAQDKACMQRVRDLHGLDIIYQYVKP